MASSSSRSPSPPAVAAAADANGTRELEVSLAPAGLMKKDCMWLAVSVQEGFRYIKAFFVGQAKKLTAKSEEAAAAAELQTSKMQVEAADEAETAKKKLQGS
ncbi:unnamed protein product [Linum trigynum]|uniref:Uncharacterized protein n=1 Tax=Linum trigynum TaxID=586398 RepID=A0AAV2G880_9ROSI